MGRRSWIGVAILVPILAIVGWFVRPPRNPSRSPTADQTAHAVTSTVPWGGASPRPSNLPIGPIQLRDVTDETGITFRHTDGSGGHHYDPETVTSGLALFDFDGDGWIDIYFPNGAPLPGSKADTTPRHALYRNRGDWTFEDVSEASGVLCTAFGLGATAADYDNDGDLDFYVSNYGPNVLFRNNGDGTFQEVTQEAGVADGDRLGAGVAFLDVDRDGLLDLFVANYMKFSYDKHFVVFRDGYPEYPGPKAYPPDRHSLYRNLGDGTFADITDASGIAQHPGKGMGIVCADYDRDGDTDIFVLNDVFQNFCFENDGYGNFEEVALANGFKYNSEGMALGSMGVDCGDYDNDGWLDFYQTSYHRELPVLFRNLGNGLLEDVTVGTGAGQGTLNNVKWGCGFVDFDNDGWRDLFVAMGHLQDLIDHYDETSSYRAKNVLLWNDGQGRFVDVTDRAGDGMLPVFSSRGAAFEDLDNDGDVDVVILNARDRPTVLRNMYYESGGRNHWLQILLRGVKTNRDGVGAQVRVVAGGLKQIAEVHSGRGYQSHWGLRLHFGLGPHDHVDRIEVRWIGGGTDIVENVPINRLAIIVEGHGIAEQPSFFVPRQ